MNRILIIFLTIALGALSLSAASTREERKAIAAGNEAYRAKQYDRALTQYKIALRDNPSSLIATFNKALAQMMVANGMDQSKQKEKEQLMEEVKDGFHGCAELRV